MENQHTPGPWQLVWKENGELELGGGIEQSTGVYSSVGFGLIANVIYKKTNILGDSKKLERATFEANARLIAAAPELLEALKECRQCIFSVEYENAFKFYGGNDYAQKLANEAALNRVKRIDSAIAKAEGK